MKNNDATNNPQGRPAAALSPREAANWFGYKDVKSFLRFCYDNGVPCMRFNKRVIRFDVGELGDWRRKKSLGLV